MPLTDDDKRLLDRLYVLPRGEPNELALSQLRGCVARADVGDEMARVYNLLQAHDPKWRPDDEQLRAKLRDAAWAFGEARNRGLPMPELIRGEAWQRGVARAQRVAEPPLVTSRMLSEVSTIASRDTNWPPINPTGDAA